MKFKHVKCRRCGHIGDLHESVYFIDETQLKLGLQCSKCQSRNMIVVSILSKD